MRWSGRGSRHGLTQLPIPKGMPWYVGTEGESRGQVLGVSQPARGVQVGVGPRSMYGVMQVLRSGEGLALQ